MLQGLMTAIMRATLHRGGPPRPRAKPRAADQAPESRRNYSSKGWPAGPIAILALSLAVSASAQTLLQQTARMERRKSAGCTASGCHAGIEPMHASPALRLGCTDCHGGDSSATTAAAAHVAPKFPKLWPSSANPVRSYTLLNSENKDFVRFMNPGDLRVAPQTCGTSGCHDEIVFKVERSLMTHGAFLWGAALYNNGAYPYKDSRFGESYAADGTPRRLRSFPAPTAEETRLRGILPFLDPLPNFEFSEPGNTLRVFERGDTRLSNRGFGTLTRTDPVFQGLQKTRLAGPLLSFLGTNDQPGDYRSSGCTACHVVYANDRDPVHSGSYAKYGHLGRSSTSDQTIPKDESGHPIRHRLTRAIPTSQCIVCHIHPGTSYAVQYTGYMWWDNETDGRLLYPEKQKKWNGEEQARSLARNPEAASLRGNWSDVEFLGNARDLNPQMKQTRFADFQGHGWLYRAVYKHDRKGTWLDADDRPIDFDDRERFEKAVHLKDIHLEKGMHCIDCHLEQDVHGNGLLYGEPRAAVEIGCIDCHGTIRQPAILKTSNSASPAPPHDLSILRTPFGAKRFEWLGDRLIQRSMVEEDVEWAVSQVQDSVTPGHPEYNEKSRLAKTIQKDNTNWGDASAGKDLLAHSNEKIACYTCHTSWMTSCFGCHLVMKANANRPPLHFKDDPSTRNSTTYNYQVLRDDIFMLGRDSTVKKGKIVPVRSSSAVLVASQSTQREWLYAQQQTISSEGLNGQAFNPHFPHSVRKRETKTCSDCHLSKDNDNNAWMAQLLLQGTNFVNFLGRFIYVAEGGHGLEAIAVTEREEPQAVIGSELHKLAYPEEYARHLKRNRVMKKQSALSATFHHHAHDAQSIQVRGEYAYVAKGHEGIRVYDIANIDNKAAPERIVSAPVSPFGQRLYVKTEDAAWIASPTTLGVDPTRRRNPVNEEPAIHPVYGYLYVADREEGLILIGAATLLDGDPRNNFLKRAVTFNPDGILHGANHVVLAGNYAYVSCDRGVVIVDLDDPARPKLVTTIPVRGAGHVAIQFRYAFICDEEGIKIVDISDVSDPRLKASVSIPDARDIYVARTKAYVAAGKNGLAIVDVENPEKPGEPRYYTADGQISDAHAVKVGMTNASLFAYLADGHNGLRVLQLISPTRTPGLWGFSPEVDPELIATYKTKGPAVALSKGLDRDRAVDESGNQIAVFGRRGARPLNFDEMRRLFMKDGKLYRVSDEPPGPPVEAREP